MNKKSSWSNEQRAAARQMEFWTYNLRHTTGYDQILLNQLVSLSLSLSLLFLPSYPSLRPESQKILLCGAESMLFCQNQSGILSQLISRMRGCVCLLHVFVWMEKGGLIKDEFKHGCQTLYKSLS